MLARWEKPPLADQDSAHERPSRGRVDVARRKFARLERARGARHYGHRGWPRIRQRKKESFPSLPEIDDRLTRVRPLRYRMDSNSSRLVKYRSGES